MIEKIEKLKELASGLNTKIDSLRNKQAKLDHVRNQVINQFRKDYNVGTVSDEIAQWDYMTWEEFDNQTMKLVGVSSSCLTTDWQEYFLLEKEKANELKALIEREDKEINKILAELHSLTQRQVSI